ncbi:antirepressor KilAC domain-containing protein [Mycobacterium phage ThulaThula]|uniref:Antirepressor n=1 Tax=Mycobacterium phage ThulaThula TaxID=2599880 RepID=A0A5J6TE83_9CAUD|nr:antirepressor KilAC domain-containing protein [Mycobacterium phage ThulaThula]QFG09066.1 antirepressor [Mycobacterium phage ThulaThula]
MSDIDSTADDRSPFEAGRIPCPQGGEDRWSLRWLMQQMGYSSWQKFEPIIERAKQAAHNEGFNVRTLFTQTVEKSGGRPQTDYLVTRFAAYLVAMNGQPSKPEVAAAQTYFAVKAREAEIAQPAIPDITTPEGLLAMTEMFADTARKLVAVEAEKKMLAAAIERDAPLVAKAEAHTGSDSDVHRQEFAREVQAWGAKRNIVIKQADVVRFLGHIGLFIRGERTDTGHATAEAIKRGLAFTHKDVARNGYAYAVGKLTPAGQDYAWKRITKYVADHGTLELPRELRSGEPA